MIDPVIQYSYSSIIKDSGDFHFRLYLLFIIYLFNEQNKKLYALDSELSYIAI